MLGVAVKNGDDALSKRRGNGHRVPYLREGIYAVERPAKTPESGIVAASTSRARFKFKAPTELATLKQWRCWRYDHSGNDRSSGPCRSGPQG
jgi:hypothetical protein